MEVGEVSLDITAELAAQISYRSSLLAVDEAELAGVDDVRSLPISRVLAAGTCSYERSQQSYHAVWRPHLLQHLRSPAEKKPLRF